MRVAVIVVALLAALGAGAGWSATAASDPQTSLTISVWPDGRAEGDRLSWTLRCSPASGTLRRAGEACRKLAAATNPFAPPRRGVVCTDQYGGPQQAVVAGRYEGKRIWIALAARNGCEISRWKRLAFLVPGGPGTPSSSA